MLEVILHPPVGKLSAFILDTQQSQVTTPEVEPILKQTFWIVYNVACMLKIVVEAAGNIDPLGRDMVSKKWIRRFN